MKIGILVFAMLLGSGASAMETWNCQLGYSSYQKFVLQIDGLSVTGTYLDQENTWQPVSTQNSDTYGTVANLTKGADGVFVFNFGYTGWDGDEVTFPLVEGQGTADAHYWRDCVGEYHSSVGVVCSKSN